MNGRRRGVGHWLAAGLVVASAQSCGGSSSDGAGAPDDAGATCRSDADCGDSGAVCFRGGCAAPCETSLDCVAQPGGRTVCDPVGRACVECASSVDCDPGDECVASRCVAFAPCASSLDCPRGQVCDEVAGRCVECAADGDCAAGERCLGRVCRAECDSDKDCTPLGLLCDAALGACVECTARRPCPGGDACVQGACVPGGTGGASGAGGAAGAGAAAGAGGLGGAGGAPPDGGAPVTCAEAATRGGHLGCEFWPTQVPNIAWPIFDFAILVTNPGASAADVTVERGGGAVASVTVAPGATETVYLPWVGGLKGGDSDVCGNVSASAGSIVERGGAHRVTSTRPVALHQWSPIEHRGTGGPPGKDWSTCPGLDTCVTSAAPLGCFSFSMDASLLLPTSALGRDHFVDAPPGWPAGNVGGWLAITGTRAGTRVDVRVASGGSVQAGGPVAATAGGELVALTVDAGDVVVLTGATTGSLAGSRVSADAPVQVLTGSPCSSVPEGVLACDHLEEIAPPIDALGTRYVVAPPPGPLGDVVGHLVRMVGTADGTTLDYPDGAPPGAPTLLAAGAAVDLGVVTTAFEVVATHPIVVTSSLQGAEAVDPTPAPNAKGDPAFTLVPPVSRFVRNAVVPTPASAGEAWLLVVQPLGATVTIDGASAPAATPVGSSGFGAFRAKLAAGRLHVVGADQPIGVQAMGYATYSSWAAPGSW